MKRKCILLQTHLRFNLNVKAFCFERFDVLIFYLWYALFIFLPALNLDFILVHVAECFDERFGQTGVGNQRNVVVDGTTADAVTAANDR